jgi:hypothetical protein
MKPSSAQAVLRYLSGGAIKGIGPVLANASLTRLVKKP